MKKTQPIHTEKDGALAFGLYILLPMIMLFALIHNTPEIFNSKNEPINDSKTSENKVSFYVKPLGDKKIEIFSISDINKNRKLTLAYNIENDKFKSMKSV